MVIPEGVTAIAGYVFSSYSSIESIVIPDGVKSIGDLAFSNCTGLTELILPASVESLGDRAFYHCRNLAQIRIPENLNSIKENTFYGYEGKRLCDMDSKMAALLNDHGVAFTDPAYPALYLSFTEDEAGVRAFTVKDVEEKAEGEIIIPDCVVSIVYNAFQSSAANAVRLPDTMETIERGAFNNCSVVRYCSIGSQTAFALGGSGSYAYDYVDPVYPYLTLESTADADGVRMTKVIDFDDSVTQPVVPEGVTHLGRYAFYNAGITSISLPQTLTEIAEYAFVLCGGLDAVELPDALTRIGENAFSNCTSLKSIDIPQGVHAIERNTFLQCISLESVKIPDSVMRIGDYAFSDCDKVAIFELPDGITQIGTRPFDGTPCTCSLQSDTAQALSAAGLSFIDPKVNPQLSLRITQDEQSQAALEVTDCDEAATQIAIPEGVKIIGDGAFKNCAALTQVVIPDSVESIGNNAFWRCSNLSQVRMSVHARRIGYGAFSECYALERVVLPDCVEQIGHQAFSNVDVYCPIGSLTAKRLSEQNTDFHDEGFRLRYTVVDGIATDELTADAYIGEEEEVTVPARVSILGSGNTYVLGQNSAVKKITVPGGVKTIMPYALAGTPSLTEIVLEDGVAEIGDHALYSNENLRRVVLPSGLKEIPERCFYGCSSLSDLSIPGSVTTIGSYAFASCRALEQVVLPESLESIDYSAFQSCSGKLLCDMNGQAAAVLNGSGIYFTDPAYPALKLSFEEDDTGARAFTLQECDRNAEGKVTVPQGVVCLWESAFYNCTKLEEIELPDGVTSVVGIAFYNCPAVVYCNIGSEASLAVSSGVYGYRFSAPGCPELSLKAMKDENGRIQATVDSCRADAAEVVIPEGVTEIGSWAFDGCASLCSVVFPGTMEVIGSYAFDGCTSLDHVDLPDGVRSVGTKAFGDKRCFCGYQTDTAVALSAAGYAFVDPQVSSVLSLMAKEDETSVRVISVADCDASVTEVVIPDIVCVIGSKAFQDCAELTSVMIPQSVTNIGSYAFSKCAALKSLTLPGNIDAIASGAFADCPAVRFCDINSQTALSLGKINADFAMQQAPELKLRASEDENGKRSVEVKGGSASMTKVEIPYGVTGVAARAFSGCQELTEAILPDSVTSVGEYAFYNCTALTRVSLSRGMTDIANRMFSGCSSLRSIAVTDNITRIGDYAFSGCSSLSSVTLLDSVNEIGTAAIAGNAVIYCNPGSYAEEWARKNGVKCTYLPVEINSAFALPQSLKAIEAEAFANLPIEAVIIPEGCERLGSRVFAGCENLRRIDIPSSVNRIAEDAFDGLDGTVLCVQEGSYTHGFVQAHGLAFFLKD